MFDRTQNLVPALAAVILAAGLRLLVLTKETIDTGSFQHLIFGKNLMQGNGFVSDGSHYPDVFRPPVYPLLVAGSFCQFTYMTVLVWIASFAVHQGASAWFRVENLPPPVPWGGEARGYRRILGTSDCAILTGVRAEGL